MAAVPKPWHFKREHLEKMVAGAGRLALIIVVCTLLFMLAGILAGDGLPGFSPLVGWVLTAVGAIMFFAGVRGMNHRS